MTQEDIVTFEYCGWTFIGHYTNRKDVTGKRIIYFLDWCNDPCWVTEDLVKIKN